MNNSLMIAVTEAREAVKSAVEKEPALTLEERLRVAFGATRNHWLVTNPDERFRAGVGGVLTATEDPDEKARIESEMRTLNALSAAMSGIPVDFAALPEDGPDPIGMLGIFRESVR